MTQNCFTPTEIWKLLRLLLIVNFLVYIWLIANKLSLNTEKWNFLIFHPYQKRPNHQVNLKTILTIILKNLFLWNAKLTLSTRGCSLLTIWLGSNTVIILMKKKIVKKNGIIARLRHFAQLNTLQTIYKALFYLLFVIWYNRLETGGQDSC